MTCVVLCYYLCGLVFVAYSPTVLYWTKYLSLNEENEVHIVIDVKVS